MDKIYLEQILESIYDCALILEPRSTFDRAIIGVGDGPNGEIVLKYDCELVIQAVVEDNGMSDDEAREFCEFNTFGAYDGPGTPVFYDPLHEEDEDDDED
jgi:hypothetical protein